MLNETGHTIWGSDATEFIKATRATSSFKPKIKFNPIPHTNPYERLVYRTNFDIDNARLFVLGLQSRGFIPLNPYDLSGETFIDISSYTGETIINTLQVLSEICMDPGFQTIREDVEPVNVHVCDRAYTNTQGLVTPAFQSVAQNLSTNISLIDFPINVSLHTGNFLENPSFDLPLRQAKMITDRLGILWHISKDQPNKIPSYLYKINQLLKPGGILVTDGYGIIHENGIDSENMRDIDQRAPKESTRTNFISTSKFQVESLKDRLDVSGFRGHLIPDPILKNIRGKNTLWVLEKIRNIR